MDFTSSLGEFEGYRVLVKVSIKLVHGEGVYVLASSVYDISRDECSFKGGIEFVDCLLRVGSALVVELHVPTFSEGTSSSFGQLAEKNHNDLLFVVIVVLVYLEVVLHHH